MRKTPTPNVRTQAIRKRKRKNTTPTSGRTGGDETETQEEGNALPAFTLKARVKAETGLFDRMEIKAEHGYFVTSDAENNWEEVDVFRRWAGAAPCKEKEREEECSKVYGMFFGVAPDNGRGKRALKVRRQSALWGGQSVSPPLFSGRLLTFRAKQADGRTVCMPVSEFHLNPSEALNHWGKRLNAAKARSWKSVLFESRDSKRLLRSLDGKRNVIPERFLDNAARGQWRYIEAVYRGIEEELERASLAVDGLPFDGSFATTKLGPRVVETYWEFSAPSAAQLVESLAPLLRAFHKDSRARTHGFDEATEGNAPTLTLFLSAGEVIQIYAKTSERIRFEVIHKPMQQNGLISGGYSAQSVAQLRGKLRCLRMRAAKRVNQVMAFLSEWAEETPQERASASRYASRWFQTLGFDPASEALLELLRVNGRIVAGRCLPKEESNLLRRARAAELLFHDESAHAYYPASIGTVLPVSGEELTAESSPVTNLGHNSETQAVPTGLISDSLSVPEPADLRVPPSPPVVDSGFVSGSFQ